MVSGRLKISIFFLIAFFVFVGAKANPKKVKKKQVKKTVLTPFQKLKKEYLVYKNSPNSNKKVEKFKDYIIKFDRFRTGGREQESHQSSYYIADINEKIYELSNDRQYLERAYDIYLSLSKYPDSYGLAAQKKVELLRSKVANTAEIQDVKQKVISKENKVLLKEILHSYENGVAKIVIQLDDKTNFEHKHLKGEPDKSKLDRIFIDIKNATYSDTKQLEVITADLPVLDRIRVGQFDPETLRVVLDVKNFSAYRAISFEDPFRIVVELFSNGATKMPITVNKPETALEKGLNTEKLPVKLVVIDMGHGGHDPGAIGYRGLKEKDVTLDIGLKLGEIIKNHFPQIEVVFTRTDDTYLKLEERTAIANEKKADLFISIHINASKNKEAYGIETYFLNFAKEERAKEVVARENASSIEGVDEVQEILKDLIVSSKYNESSMLASLVQKNLVNRIKLEYDDVLDLGVKQGPFYVLLGAAMPSVLVETAFISNPREATRLSYENYRRKIAEGLFEGVKEYITKSVAASARGKELSGLR